MRRKQRWIFIGRDQHGWLGFRCVEGPGSLLHSDHYHWVGDYYVDPTHFWRTP